MATLNNLGIISWYWLYFWLSLYGNK